MHKQLWRSPFWNVTFSLADWKNVTTVKIYGHLVAVLQLSKGQRSRRLISIGFSAWPVLNSNRISQDPPVFAWPLKRGRHLNCLVDLIIDSCFFSLTRFLRFLKLIMTDYIAWISLVPHHFSPLGVQTAWLCCLHTVCQGLNEEFRPHKINNSPQSIGCFLPLLIEFFL